MSTQVTDCALASVGHPVTKLVAAPALECCSRIVSLAVMLGAALPRVTPADWKARQQHGAAGVSGSGSAVGVEMERAARTPKCDTLK